ncbi:MAG: flagellar hook-length control protein FliK [Aureliella sp.]
MDGSIADSTTLRIRNSLQFSRQASAKQADHGLFEELLKVPAAAPPRCKQSHEAPAGDDVLADAPEAKVPANATQSRERPSEEPVQDDEHASAEARDANATAATLIPPGTSPPIAAEQAPVAAQADNAQATTQTKPAAAREIQPAAVTEAPVQASQPRSKEPQPQESLEKPGTAVPATEPVATAPQETAKFNPVTDLDAASPAAAPTASVAGPVVEPNADAQADAAAETAGKQAKSKSEVTTAQAVGPAVQVRPQPTASSHAGDHPAENKDPSATGEATAAGAVANQVQADSAGRAERTRRSDGDDRREKWYAQDDAQSPAAKAKSADDAEKSNDDDSSKFADSSATVQPAAANVPDAALASAVDASAAASSDMSQFANLPGAGAAAQAAAALSSSTGSANEGGNATSAAGPRGASAASATSPGAPTSFVAGTGSTAAAGASAQRAPESSAEKGDPEVRQLSQQERVRLVQRVARSFSRLGPDGGQITLKLHPPQLGVLNVSVRMEGQTMSAKLQTESSAARDAILENLPVLRERLAEQGVDVASFQVDVSGGGDMAAGQQTAGSFDDGSRGEAAGGNRQDIDYRRLSRSSTVPRSVSESRDLDTRPWLARSSTDRTLDIRA